MANCFPNVPCLFSWRRKKEKKEKAKKKKKNEPEPIQDNDKKNKNEQEPMQDHDKKKKTENEPMEGHDKKNKKTCSDSAAGTALVSSEWETSKVVSGDGGATMEAQILFGRYDQFHPKVQGEGACSVLSVSFASWMAVHGDSIFPTRTFNELIIRGAREWRRMRPQSVFSDGHFDLETALKARTCQLVANLSKSFTGMFKSDYLRREINVGLMGFEEIWDGIAKVVEKSSGPVYYVVRWHHHFFLLRADKTEFFIVESIGRKLNEVNDRAHMIRFGESTRIQGKGGEITKGKDCCRIYIQQFIVDTVFRDDAGEENEWEPEEYLRRVQVEFTCLEPAQPVPVIIRNEPASPAQPLIIHRPANPAHPAQPVPVMIPNKPAKPLIIQTPAEPVVLVKRPAIREKKNEEATNGDLQLGAGGNKLRIWLKSATLLIRFLVLWISLFIMVKWASLINTGLRVNNQREWSSPQADSVHHRVHMEMPREEERNGDLHLPVNSRGEVTT